MLRTEKQNFVSALEEIYKESNSIIVAHYHKSTVSQMTDLRKSLRECQAGLKVVKNTLSIIAANNAGLQSITNLFSGPVVVAYSKHSIEAIKIIVEFSKINENLKIIGGIVENQVVEEEQIRQLATMPSLDELRAQIIQILEAPASDLVRIVGHPAAELVNLIERYSKQSN